jgi:deazaflavin-dependent oxidoreductase (nitroreductase family)
LSDMNAWNAKVLDEFRANAGKVGPPFEGSPVLILHSVGAKSGQDRLNPLVYQQVGDAWAIFASKGGAPTNPDWYYNLLAHPDTVIEVGADEVPVTARVAGSEEREPIWTTQKERFEGFAGYEKATTRTIPVVILERRG